MKSLSVFEGVPIPVDYAAIQKYVALGSSGAGKTFMLARFAEQCCDADIFFVILDPVGKHYALRAGPDGDPKGGKKDVWVIGGLHGDIPLDPNSGALIADTVVDHPGRYVVDVSQFDTDEELYEFAAAFGKRLFRRKAKDPGWPMLLMLEEAEWFLPETPAKGQQVVKGPFGRIVRQGRNHGIGVFLVFQRPAAGDKGAISQCKVLIAKQMSHNLDIEAVRKWAQSNGSKEQLDEMIAALASMEPQEAYVWSPEWLKVFKRTTVLARTTFDSSANVKHGGRMTAVELVPLDVDALGQKMKEVAERAVDEDPKRLNTALSEARARLEKAEQRLTDLDALQAHADEQAVKISQLERDLSSRPTEWEVREVPVLDEAQLAPLWELADELAGAQAEVARVREIVESTNQVLAGNAREKGLEPPVLLLEAPPPSPPPSPAPARTKAPESNSDLGKAAREALEVIVAFYPTAPTPQQIGLVLGKHFNAGPFRGALNVLEEGGYTEGGKATAMARNMMVSAKPLPTPEEIQRKWQRRFKGSTADIFGYVLDAYPGSISYAELGTKIGKNHNAGPIRGMFNDLVAYQLVTEDSSVDGLRANDLLFKIRG